MVEFKKLHEVKGDKYFFGSFSVNNPDTCELILCYDDLNDEGKAEAIKRIQEMMLLPKYQKVKSN